ncbi:MAG: transporter [Candidatus Kapaibacterium sp.]
MKSTTTLLALLLATTFAFSQRQTTIDSDRPGQSMSAHTVGKNVLQIQTGFDYTSHSNDPSYVPRYSFNVFGNETNVRFGLLDILEINGTIGYRLYNQSYEDKNRKDNNQHGAEFLRVGTRVNIIDHDGLTPAIAASAELILPFETDVYKFVDYGFRGMVIIKQPITKDWAVTGNIGIFDNPAVLEFFYPYTLNTSYSFNDKLSAFIEIYGYLNAIEFTENGIIDNGDINYDAGVGYLLNNDLLLDFSIGQDNSFGDGDWYVNAGVSFRFGVGSEE